MKLETGDFKVGDRVRVIGLDNTGLRNITRNYIGMVGKIVAFDADGDRADPLDLEVQLDDIKWCTWNFAPRHLEHV